ncbi:MAG: hypothetical protein ACREPD_05455 [Stenotrophomonas sp.]|uniref:hypothetical protein n=1 Tax=Stenotrophomonas sp. TaxID=69392 RepID=UPI003D6D9389
MTRFQLLRFQQLVEQRAEQLGYCRVTQLMLARHAHPCGPGSLRVQAHQVVPYPYQSATAPGAA